MDILTINELLQWTRAELCGLEAPAEISAGSLGFIECRIGSRIAESYGS